MTKRLGPKAAEESADLAESLAEEGQELLDLPKAEEVVTLFPSASKTDLLFACTWPWGKTVRREEVGERTRFGSAFHEGMELLLGPDPNGFNSIAHAWDVDPTELRDRLDEAFPVISKWLGGENMWGLNFTAAGLQTEISVAINPTTGKARILPDGPGDSHDYPGRKPGEVPGTADVVSILTVAHTKYLLVLDHKSGWNVAADWQPQTPAELGQLRTLALGLSKIHQVDQVIVALFHARAGSIPIIYADMLTPDDLEAHRKALKAAMGNIGSGWMRPGIWCAHCQAFSICPTQVSALIELKRPPGPLTAERVGAIHQAANLYDNLRKRLAEEIRAWVRLNGSGIRPDGQSVELVEKEVTGLSQASIVRALGKLEGGKMIEKLRKLGAIETKTRMELRAVRR